MFVLWIVEQRTNNHSRKGKINLASSFSWKAWANDGNDVEEKNAGVRMQTNSEYWNKLKV